MFNGMHVASLTRLACKVDQVCLEQRAIMSNAEFCGEDAGKLDSGHAGLICSSVAEDWNKAPPV